MRTHSGWALAVAALTIFAAYLRLHGLGDRSLWQDEFATLQQVRLPFSEMIKATAGDTYPPGFNVLAWVFIRLFGQSEFGLRLPAALLGIAAVPATFWMGRIVSGPKAGLIAAALLTIGPFALAYSQEARGYSLLLLSGALFTGSAYVSAKEAWGWGTGRSLLTGILLLYSHPYGTLLFASVIVPLLVSLYARPTDRRLRRSFLAAVIGAGVFFLPWAVVLVRVASQIQQHGFWLPYPTPLWVLTTLSIVLGGGVLSVVFLVVVLLAAGVRLQPAPGRVPGTSTLLLLSAGFAPLLLGTAVSLVGTPIVLHRYFIGSLPALLVLVGASATVLGVSRWRAAVLAFALTLPAALTWLTSTRSAGNEDWRNAAAYVATTLRANDCLVVGGRIEALAVEYYGFPNDACLVTLDRSSGSGPEALRAGGDAYLLAINAWADENIKQLRPLLAAGDWTEREARFSGLTVVSFSRR